MGPSCGTALQSVPIPLHAADSMWRQFLLRKAADIDFHLASAALIVMTFIALLAVVFRFVLNDPFIWSDEAVKLVFAWFCFAGMSVIAKHTMHLRVDIVDHLVGPKLKTLLRLFGNLFVLGTAVLLLVTGAQLCFSQAGNQFASMPISRAWSFAALPVGALLMAFRLFPILRNDVHALRHGGAEAEESD